MSGPLRILLVAGEASGDLHGAALVRALRQRVPALDICGVGGPRLRAAGMRVLVDTEHVATIKRVRGWDFSSRPGRQGQAWDQFVNAMWARYRKPAENRP